MTVTSEELRRVMDDLPVGFYRTTPGGAFVYANPALADVLGYETVEDLMKVDIRGLYVDSEERERWLTLLRERGSVAHHDVRVRRPDDEVRWIRHSARLVDQGDDDPGPWVEGVVEDVTDLHLAEEERLREEALRLLLERVAMASNAVRSPRDAYATALKEISAATGWPLGHVYEPEERDPEVLRPTGVWYTEDPERFRGLREATHATPLEVGQILPGKVYEEARARWIRDVTEEPQFLRGRGLSHAEVRAAFAFPVMAGDKPAAVVEFFSDRVLEVDDRLLDVMEKVGTILGRVVERDRAQARVERLNRELEARVEERTAELKTAVEELDAFSYSVSHDLRAPLRALDGFSQAILEDYGDELADTGRDYLGRIRAAAQRMGETLEDLLRLSRISRRELTAEPVDLSGLAREVARELREQEPERNVTFEAPEELPARGDPKLLRILLENLMGNAWKFTGREDSPRVCLGRRDVDGQSAYYVSDNGSGFDMDYADKLFRPFQRLHRSDEFPGTGIGLATVRRIAHRHGGRTWAEGEPGEGATFYFTLGTGKRNETVSRIREA